MRQLRRCAVLGGNKLGKVLERREEMHLDKENKAIAEMLGAT